MYTKRAPRKQTLNVLVCGTSGTGKSTFINTLVGREIILESQSTPAAEFAHTLVFQPTTVELDDVMGDGSRLVLTLVETEGFGAGLDHSGDIEQVANYIEGKFDSVLAEESRIRRNPRFKDDRLDCCLYFIEPTSHGLREIDVLTLKRLSPIVNVIPIISRSDQLTPSEQVLNKRMVNEDLKHHDILTFDFQYSDDAVSRPVSHVDGYVDNVEDSIQDAVPLAITGSNQFNEHGVCLFSRVLSYGQVQILDPEHCDFTLLKNALFSGFFTELKDRTHEVLYETYRTHRLDPHKNHRASLLLPQELADHSAKLKQAQMEREARMLHEREVRVNAEIEAKKAMLLKREQELRELELKMAEQQQQQQQQQPTQFVSEERPQSVEERRVHQVRSKKELREHTQKLHAELGDLELEKQGIKNQHDQLGELVEISEQLSIEQISIEQLSVEQLSVDQLDSEFGTTSPLHVKAS